MTAPADPVITVIIPVYRQWDEMALLLRHLAAQTVAPDLWRVVIVANDGGGAALVPGLPAHMARIACDTPGSYAARNAGLAQATTPWLLFTDADCLPPPGWLAAHLDALPATPALQAGPVHMIPPAPDAPWRARFWACFDLLRGIPQARYVARGYAATANLAVHRAVFDRTGPFDPARLSGGDAAFCRRATAQGFALTLAADAGTGHPCRDTWAALSRKARRVKSGQVLHGSAGSRTLWVLRSATPPLRQMLRFAKNPAPVRHRVAAVAVLFALWGAELAEIPRLLLLRSTPERR